MTLKTVLYLTLGFRAATPAAGRIISAVPAETMQLLGTREHQTQLELEPNIRGLLLHS